MLTLTRERAEAGWKYRIAGYCLHEYDVVRKIDWEAPDSEPEWEVRRHDKVLLKGADLDESLDFAEATYRLDHAEA